MPKYLIKILLIMLFAATLQNNAQSNSHNAAFTKTQVRVNYLNNYDRESLNDFWSAKHGAGVIYSTPFYAGNISLGVEYLPFSGRIDKYPDFQSLFISLTWYEKILLPLNSSLGIGVKGGSFMMIFDDETLTEFEGTESEIALSPLVNFELGISQYFSLYAEANFISVLTAKRIKLFNLSGGISYNCNTPAWLLRILK